MRNGDKFYVAQLDTDKSKNGILVYKKPKEYTLGFNNITIQPASGYTAVQVYGKEIYKVWHAIAKTSRYTNEFHEGDLFYLDGAKPQGETEYGLNANAYADSVLTQNQVIKIVLKKRVVDE